MRWVFPRGRSRDGSTATACPMTPRWRCWRKRTTRTLPSCATGTPSLRIWWARRSPAKSSGRRRGYWRWPIGSEGRQRPPTWRRLRNSQQRTFRCHRQRLNLRVQKQVEQFAIQTPFRHVAPVQRRPTVRRNDAQSEHRMPRPRRQDIPHTRGNRDQHRPQDAAANRRGGEHSRKLVDVRKYTEPLTVGSV